MSPRHVLNREACLHDVTSAYLFSCFSLLLIYLFTQCRVPYDGSKNGTDLCFASQLHYIINAFRQQGFGAEPK